MLLIKMRNKNAQGNTFWIIIAAVIGLIILWVVVKGLIGDIFVDKQISFLGQESERSLDCDNDGATGFNDACPCVYSKQKLDKDKDESCGTPDTAATGTCPKLCKGKK